MLKVLSIIGTRPEAVKMAPVIKALQNHIGIESILCVTAQHREMMDQVLDLFGLKPAYDLDLMQANQTLPLLSARIMEHLSPVIRQIQPDWILAQGDTTTVLCTAMLAYYHQVNFGHVEAGLRTGNKWQPFPEEGNRRMAGTLADLHFAPTEHSRTNLLREGVPDWRICVTGNPVIDALNEITARLPDPETNALLANVNQAGKKLVLMTAHRRENFGQPLRNIFHAVKRLAQIYQDEINIVYPVHLNPNVREAAYEMLSDQSNIFLMDPLPYLSLVHVMRNATLVLTDSGGLQEEATALHIPTLVFRNVTERPEGVEAGVLKLVGSDPEVIIGSMRQLLDNPSAYQEMASRLNPFGDGNAAHKIVTALMHFHDPDREA
ncbi:MAG: UDP-N-acetylglucosamine 2-epimerase (non-hydrolyzing) [Anaerolineae bacterium]|nr:UDP-N-acetylglucosamine 2-epimerase (non-hydrolyzing) [Anaerolineae bacterium]